ncbi:MAG: dTMP kinase [Gammaproteobacteria bacterium]|jgi:dTMP kinase|nr:dTMP kinase [Gammaproteobacteria bacterium]
MTGRFITIEGIEGVGKSTNVDFVAEHFRVLGETVQVTREPGGTPMAERIRDLILSANRDELSDLGELVLMFAARAEHLESLIKPALERGETVICDRFTDATFAYQGGGRGLDPAIIDNLRLAVQGALQPNLTVLLDAPIEVSAERIAGRAWQDRFEQEQAEFFGRVRAVYLEIAAREPERVKLIDASQPLNTVQAAIKAELDRM